MGKEKIKISNDLNNTIAKNLQTIKNLIVELEKQGATKTKHFFALLVYSGVAQNDLQLLYQKFDNSETPYEKNMFIRLQAMTIKEFIDDIFPLFNKAYLESKNNLVNNEIFLDFKPMRKDLNTIKKQHYKDLKNIRHFASAHKNKDPLTLLSFTSEEIPVDVSQISIEIIEVITGIIKELRLYMLKFFE